MSFTRSPLASAGPAGFLSRLARRTLAAPAVRPRLASRFETPRMAAGHTGAMEDESDRESPVAASAPLTVARESSRDLSQQVVGPDDSFDSRAVEAEPESSSVRPISSMFVSSESQRVERLTVREIETHVTRLDAPMAPLPSVRGDEAQFAVGEPPSRYVRDRAPQELAVPDRRLGESQHAQPQPVQLQQEKLAPLVLAAPPITALSAHDEARIPQPSLHPIPAFTTASVSAVHDTVAPIEIVIGRIEIHTSDSEPQRPVTRRAESRVAPGVSLTDYLRRREGRGQ